MQSVLVVLASAQDFVEWAPFWPSLPCGDAVKGAVLLGCWWLWCHVPDAAALRGDSSPFAELPSEAEAGAFG